MSLENVLLHQQNNADPHACELCNKGCLLLNEVINYMNSFSNNSCFQCEVCGMNFAKKKFLTTHKSVHNLSKCRKNSPGEKFFCIFCCRSFASCNTLLKHKEKIHGVISTNDKSLSTLSSGLTVSNPIINAHQLGRTNGKITIGSSSSRSPFENNGCGVMDISLTEPSNLIDTESHQDSTDSSSASPRIQPVSATRTDNLDVQPNQAIAFAHRVADIIKNKLLSRKSTNSFYTCQYCTKKFTMRLNLIQHEKIHSRLETVNVDEETDSAAEEVDNVTKASDETMLDVSNTVCRKFRQTSPKMPKKEDIMLHVPGIDSNAQSSSLSNSEKTNSPSVGIKRKFSSQKSMNLSPSNRMQSQTGNGLSCCKNSENISIAQKASVVNHGKSNIKSKPTTNVARILSKPASPQSSKPSNASFISQNQQSQIQGNSTVNIRTVQNASVQHDRKAIPSKPTTTSGRISSKPALPSFTEHSDCSCSTQNKKSQKQISGAFNLTRKSECVRKVPLHTADHKRRKSDVPIVIID